MLNDKYMLDIYLFKGALQVFLDFAKRFFEEIRSRCEHQGPYTCEVEKKSKDKDLGLDKNVYKSVSKLTADT